jgi:thioredoxin 1
MRKIHILKLLGLILGVAAYLSPVQAAGFAEYSDEVFASAQADNKPVLLDFYASWCSTCKKQQPVLKGLSQEDALSGIVILTVDYDNSDELKKRFNVSSQSTLIMFKGEKEVGREIGVTDKDKIRDLIKKAL